MTAFANIFTIRITKILKVLLFWIFLLYISLLVVDHLLSISTLFSQNLIRPTLSHVPNIPYQKLDLAYGDKKWSETCNSLGLRDREFPTTPRKFRLLLIGDSFTFGHGVKRDSCWAKLLEKMIWQKDLYDSIEIVNAGMSGSCPYYYLKTLEYTLPLLHPSHVLICIQAGDLSNTEHLMRFGRTSPTYLLEEIRLLYRYKDRRPLIKRFAEKAFPTIYSLLKLTAKKIQSQPVTIPSSYAAKAEDIPFENKSKILSFSPGEWEDCKEIILLLGKKLGLNTQRIEKDLDSLKTEDREILFQFIALRINHDKGWELLNTIFFNDPLMAIRSGLFVKDEKAWKECKNQLQEIVVKTRAKNCLPLFTYFPVVNEFKNPIQREMYLDSTHTFRYAIKSFCKEKNVPYWDIHPAFEKVIDVDSLYIPLDGHWNEKGNIFVAKALMEKLIQSNLFISQ